MKLLLANIPLIVYLNGTATSVLANAEGGVGADVLKKKNIGITSADAMNS